MSNPLNIAFLWHMHQPEYKDPRSGLYRLPWSRLHTVKDYYSMPALLDKHPDMRLNFNLVPSLLKQIIDLAGDDYVDEAYALSRKPAESLTNEEKRHILLNFFMANWDTMVRRFPRYDMLLAKRGIHASFEALEHAAPLFSVQDMRDLQVWFNLTWINRALIEDDPELKRIFDKGQQFTEEEKNYVLDAHVKIARRVVPKYREVMERGQAELSTSPFYHPILPLLYNTEFARRAMPNVRLPNATIQYPEDADAQVARGVALFEQLFGKRPEGMWPSEGSVAEEIIPIIAKNGIKWIATDEGILVNSLGLQKPRDAKGSPANLSALYRPYTISHGDSSVAIVFRDHMLSDLIGFVYSHTNAEHAVEDFIGRLREVQDYTSHMKEPRLVSVILDGENAWEFYSNGGYDFLDALYARIEKESFLRPVTIGGFLEENPPHHALERLHSGSWIDSNFDIWIGGDEENRAWELLAATREELVKYQQTTPDSPQKQRTLEAAWVEIYTAEGSDWNWWYGRHHTSSNDQEFDELFRLHLVRVYELIGQRPPADLFAPIISHESHPTVDAIGLISPIIDGENSHYYEWAVAGRFDVKTLGGTMHRAESIVSRVYFGFDLNNLYLRLDDADMLQEKLNDGVEVVVEFFAPVDRRVRIGLDSTTKQPYALLERRSNGTPEPVTPDGLVIAVKRVMEVSVPFAQLGVKPEEMLKFVIALERNGLKMEVWPSRGPVELQVPTQYFDLVNWYV